MMGRKLLAALLAAMMLSTAALAAAPEPEAVPEDPETVTENPETLPEEPKAVTEEPEICEGWFEADLIQAGSLTGPQTMPDEVSLYAYNEAAAMETIYQGLKARRDSIDLGTYGIHRDELSELYNKTVNDHPELFYVHTGCKYNYTASTNTVVSLFPTYHNGTDGSRNLMTDAAKAAFQSAADAALEQIQGVDTELEKALLLHDYLVVNCRYNWNVGMDQSPADITVFSAYGALVDQDAVCQGYALAYKYLLDRAGVKAVTLSSSAMNHMWNQVQIDGNWYHVDATWDDPFPNMEGKAYHRNFLRSDHAMRNPTEGSKHDNWDKTAYVCTDTTFETGYAFNDCQWPLYRQDGQFYSVGCKTDKTYSVYRSSGLAGGKSEAEEFYPLLRETEKGYYPDSFGVVWLNHCMYYIGQDSRLHCLSLEGYGESVSANTITFTPSDQASGTTHTRVDYLGLRYQNNKFQATSSTRYGYSVGTFDSITVEPIPESWRHETTAGILGLTDGSTKAGVRWNREEPAILYAACRSSSGKLISVRSVQMSLQDGIVLADLGNALSGNWKLFLASPGEFKPLCAAMSSQ